MRRLAQAQPYDKVTPLLQHRFPASRYAFRDKIALHERGSALYLFFPVNSMRVRACDLLALSRTWLLAGREISFDCSLERAEIRVRWRCRCSCSCSCSCNWAAGFKLLNSSGHFEIVRQQNLTIGAGFSGKIDDERQIERELRRKHSLFLQVKVFRLRSVFQEQNSELEKELKSNKRLN